MMLHLLALALTLWESTAAPETLLMMKPVTSADPHAVCYSGQAPVYYATPPRGGGGADSWMIMLIGQGAAQAIPWCFPPPKNATSNWTDMSKPHNCDPCGAPPPGPAPAPPPNASLPCGGAHCVFSSNCFTNPTFCNFGKILIPDCTNDNWCAAAGAAAVVAAAVLRCQAALALHAAC